MKNYSLKLILPLFLVKRRSFELARQFNNDPELKLHFGNLLTVDKIISQSSTKRRIGEQNSFLAVEMESAAVAEVAHMRRE